MGNSIRQGMKIKTSIQQPEEVEIKMSITMPMREWERLLEQLSSDYPSWKLGNAIRASIDKTKSFIEEDIEQDEITS